MKRLLCLISCMNTGGAETFLMKIYRTIDRSKYQMDFCVNIKEKGFYDDEINSLGGRVYHIPSKSESVFEFKRGLSQIVKENQYDYILRITSNCMGFMDLKIAKKAGAKVCCARSSNASDGGGIKNKLTHIVGRMLYNKYVDVKIAPSDLAARYTFGDKVYNQGGVNILHNGVDISRFEFNTERRAKVRKEFGISDDCKLIGHVGRFDVQKNHTFLLDIFKKILDCDDKTVLLMVGDGPLQSEMREKAESLGISDNIIFAGIRSDIPDLLAAMDVFVFPSFYEGMPNTVIEAQATGLPCVIADTITKEANITGLVQYLPLGDPDMWAKAALASIDSTRMDTKDSFISNKYDIESVVNEFARLVYGEKDF